MGHDDGRPLNLLDDVGNGKGLARAGHTQERLMCQAGVNTVHQPINGFGLIPSWLKRGIHLEGAVFHERAGF